MTTEIRQDTGYGLIPKRIMRNKDLSIQAKAIYSYLASFAGNTGRAFPSVSLMLGELNISRDTFYRYRNELEEAGAIEVVKERTEGQFAKNIYFLHNSINPPCPKSSYTVNSTTVNSDTVSSYTVNQDTISNSPISNSIKSNNSKSNSGLEQIIMTIEEEAFINILEEIDKYPLDRKRDIEMYKTLEGRYPELDLLEAIKDWKLYKLDQPLKTNSNARSQINSHFKKYVEWGKCLKGGGPGGKTQRRNEASKSINESVPISEEELSQSKYDF